MERRKSRTGAAQRATLSFLVIALALVAWSRCPGARERLERDPPAAEPSNEARDIAQGAPIPAGITASETFAEPSAVAHTGSQRVEVEHAVEPSDELWIVDAATKQPLEGARVRFANLSNARMFDWWEGRLDLSEDAAWLASEGAHLSSDAAGLVKLPKAGEDGLAIARFGELFGLWWVDPAQPKPWRLELLPDAPWDVRVRDLAGVPIAGVEIRWCAKSGETLAQVPTNEKGLARFEHARWRLAQAPDAAFTVAPMAILREPAVQKWDSREPPIAPAELVLPTLGRVQLALRDSDGAPWPHEDNYVAVRDANGARSEQSVGLQQFVGWWAPPSAQCSTHVELGLDLEARWRVQGAQGEVVAQARGPVEVGETVRIELVSGIDSPVLRTRLLDLEGRPLARTLVRARMREVKPGGGGWKAEAEHRTDAQGRLQLPCAVVAESDALSLRFELECDPVLQAVVTLRDVPRSGWIDIGDVKLAPCPIVAAGRVVDASGVARAGLSVDVIGVPKALVAARAPTYPVAGKASEDGPLWAIFAELSWEVVTDAQGGFELRSAEELASVRVRAVVGPSARGPWIDAEVGRTDFELVLPTLASVEARLVLPPGLRPSDLRVRLNHLSDGPDLSEDGSWLLENLPPGPAWIVVNDATLLLPEALASVRCTLVAGKRTRVPDIDLSDLRVIRLRVVDERGAPLDAWGEFWEAGGGEDDDISVQHGEARLITRHARVDARIWATGYRSTSMPDLQDGTVVVLAKGHPIRLRLRDANALPEFPLRLFSRFDGQVAAFDRSGTLDLIASVAGSRSIVLEVRDTRSDRNWGPALKPDGPAREFAVHVPESRELSELEIDVPAHVIADAVRRLKEE